MKKVRVGWDEVIIWSIDGTVGEYEIELDENLVNELKEIQKRFNKLHNLLKEEIMKQVGDRLDEYDKSLLRMDVFTEVEA